MRWQQNGRVGLRHGLSPSVRVPRRVCRSSPRVSPSYRLLLTGIALMNWAGSEFMLKSFINYPQMLQVYNLVLFSLTFGTQMLDFSKPSASVAES